MKDFFKPEDFNSIFGSSNSGSVFRCKAETAEYANEKLNAEIESWPMVILGDKGHHPSHDKWVVDDGGFNMTKFIKKARLAFVEEIKKELCNHEPRTKYFGISMAGQYSIGDDSGAGGNLALEPICKHCGVGLEAVWREKKK